MITLQNAAGSWVAILVAIVLLVTITVSWGLLMALCAYGWRRALDRWHTKKPVR